MKNDNIEFINSLMGFFSVWDDVHDNLDADRYALLNPVIVELSDGRRVFATGTYKVFVCDDEDTSNEKGDYYFAELDSVYMMNPAEEFSVDVMKIPDSPDDLLEITCSFLNVENSYESVSFKEYLDYLVTFKDEITSYSMLCELSRIGCSELLPLYVVLMDTVNKFYSGKIKTVGDRVYTKELDTTVLHCKEEEDN